MGKIIATDFAWWSAQPHRVVTQPLSSVFWSDLDAAIGSIWKTHSELVACLNEEGK